MFLERTVERRSSPSSWISETRAKRQAQNTENKKKFKVGILVSCVCLGEFELGVVSRPRRQCHLSARGICSLFQCCQPNWKSAIRHKLSETERRLNDDANFAQTTLRRAPRRHGVLTNPKKVAVLDLIQKKKSAAMGLFGSFSKSDIWKLHDALILELFEELKSHSN